MDEDVEDLAPLAAASDEEHNSNRNPSWRALFNFTRKAHFLPLLAAIVPSVASGIVVPILSIILGKLFNQFTVYGAGALTGHDLVHKVSKYALALVGLGSGAIVLNAGYFGFWLVFGELQAKSVRDTLFDGLLEKDMAWFDMRKAGVNTLLSRLQIHIRELQMATAQPLGFTVQYTITTIAALGLALYYAWDLALITLSTVPIAAVALGWISSRMQTTVQGHIDGLTKASKLANVSISSIDTVKAFNGQDDEIFSYSRAIRSAARLYLRQARSNALQIGFVRFTTLSLFVQGFWYGAHLINTGKKNPGDVLTAFWACLMATQTAEQILPQMLVLEKGRAAGATLQAALTQMRRGKKVVKMVGSKAPKFCDGDIQVRNVSFSYPSRPDQVVLNSANFFFGAGETTFIVGASGSGKSTISNLLMQFYDSSSGEIIIDGEAIQTLDPKWLRNNITLIQQQSVLFNETLLRNIAFGSRDKSYQQVSREDVQNAMKTAYLQHVVDELPKGLNTLVGTGGSALSGGQKQRVAIARARLRDTPILIIDEGTSALDHLSRTIVMKEIRKWRTGRTTIIITHDLSQIEKGDFVYVMSEGEIVQEGFSHALEKVPNGMFTRLLQPESAISPSSARSTFSGSFLKRSNTSTRMHVGNISPSKGLSNPFDSAPASPASSRLSVDTIDSMDIEFRPRPRLLIPSIFGRPSESSWSRRTSQGIISPISPTAFPMSRPSRMPSMSVRPRRNSLQTTKSHEPQMAETSLVNKRLTLNLGMSSLSAAVHRVSTVEPAAPPSKILSPGLSSASQDDRSSEEDRPKDSADGHKAMSLTKILLTVGPVLTWQKRAILIAGFTCAAIHAVATPMFSWVFAKLLATFSLPREEQSKTALKWSLSVLGVAIVDSIASYFMHYLLEVCGQAWIDTLRVQAMKRILDQPRAWFDSEETSSLVESLDRNAEEMRNLLGRFAAFVFVAVIMLIIAIVWSLVLCWKLTLVALACAPAVYAVTQLFETLSGKWEGKSNDAGAVASSIFTETFGAIRTVRSMTLEGYFHEKYIKATDGALRAGMKRSGFSGVLFGISESGIVFITALVFYYGAVLASKDSNVQNILTVFTMLLFSIANATNVIAFIPQIGASQDTASKLLRLANLPYGRSHEHAGNVRLPNLGSIRFKDVSFAYPARPDSYVLNSLALTINPRTSTALVGSSGCGKSTIASLLLGLYPPTTGTITIATLPTTALHLPTLRSLISVVPQSPIVFAGTVAENIAYALPKKSPLAKIESIRAAAISAGIDDFIMSLPQAYNTAIGEGGSGLSGGQTQRLAIARAIVRRPELLVLDEATSALDGESARGIYQLVKTLEKDGVGCLIVTHKKEMMRACKLCVVLGGGRVLESGPYDELMKRRGGEMRKLMG